MRRRSEEPISIGVHLGAHESIAGGLLLALDRAAARGATVLQIFTASPSRWAGPRRDPGELAELAAESRRRRLRVLCHASYLINLATGDPVLARRSCAALVAELERCEAAAIEALVLHPGAHGGDGVAVGVRRAAATLRLALARTRGHRCRILLEDTAGAGTTLGGPLGELAALLAAAGRPRRLGVCLDTCHLFAAGYDLRAPAGRRALLAEVEDGVGLERVGAFHLNDCRAGLGERRDRHAPIGEGGIGAAALVALCRDRRFADLPGIVELPARDVPRSLRRLGLVSP